ncbi:MAG: T9SS type A sorting domain-containing protein, partial [Mariniphaga sp.]
LCWGFWAGRHWKPEAAYYSLDWSIRPQGEMYKKLVFEDWWTPDQTLNPDASGSAGFGSCFLGTYEVEVSYNGTSFVKEVPVHFNLENQITINVEDLSVTSEGTQHDDTPVFTQAETYRQMEDGTVKVYPNPASDRLHVELTTHFQGSSNVEVTNSTGVLVLSRRMNLTYENILELPRLNPGFYILSIKSGNRRVTEKFTVE